MRKRIAAGVLMMALAISTAACTQNTAPAEATETEQSAPAETIEQGAPLNVTIEDVTTLETLTVMGDSVEMEITYPKVTGMDDQIIEERINKTIRQAFKSEHALLSGEANVIEDSYSVTHISDKWISIRFDFTTDPAGDGKQTYQLFTSFTVDMKTGEPILFHNLWTNLNAEEQKVFIESVDSMLQDGQVNPISGPDTFPEAYINDNNFVIYYYEGAMTEIAMPLETAASLLIK